MDVEVVAVFVLHDFVIEVVFTDSTVKAVNLKNLVTNDIMFKTISDKNVFDQVVLKNGKLVWPDGVEIVSNVLYEM